MDEKSILITGANGQLGRALRTLLPKARAGDREILDITDKNLLDNFDWTDVKIIINAAAYTNVDGAETDEGAALARRINVDGLANLADVAGKRDLILVHISTDYVFDGTKSDHLENEVMSPINVYGQTKAVGDEIVLKLAKSYLLRASWVIGDGGNFVRTMLDLGRKGVSPSVVDDQFGRLTFADELARAIKFLLENKAEYGVYNITNSGPVKSWAEITEEIFADVGIDLPVRRISTERYLAGKQNIAPRPKNSDLNLDKLRAVGFGPKNWQEELKTYIMKAIKEGK
jgi:dTDP-4-dehydrorhamnose 3,5-epimerase